MTTPNLTDRERRVLVYMSEDVPSDYAVYMRAICAAEVIETGNVRRVVRSLARKGMVKLSTAFNPADWSIAGSGYAVTDAGRAEAERIRAEVTL
ncbi:hypothetical protein SAMN05428953_12670 [Mesorhizobium muleiense]|uniref:Uncharacterized protein n=1 Tax=Mesorhizobium muleiense TaxID=1004279 RepID=A0A1G9H558_9HYPH|nr:hypothetical protein [Mesorhizobium muleiense]SDL08005.1 hypothetical protein SAMN05428953_12670 [Mesorhizobium muleiense]